MTRQRKFPRRADARLLELAAQFRRLRRRMDVLSVQEDRCRDWEADGPGLRAKTTAIVSECWRIRGEVCATMARTPEGLQAKAEIALWEFDDPDDHPDVACAWSLARDIEGRARA
jgi:hypothetical protein